MRRLTVIAALLLLTGCVTRDLAWCSSNATVTSRLGSNRTRAVEVLASAERLESSHIGAGGAPSCRVSAYRHILGRSDAAATFREAYERSTAAGKIYALAGLYDADRPEFDRLIDAARSSSPATFEKLDSCVGTSPSREEIFEQLARGELSAWWRPTRSSDNVPGAAAGISASPVERIAGGSDADPLGSPRRCGHA